MATGSWTPADEDLRPGAEALAAAAGAAPSLHNAQPWRFRVGQDHVDVLLDRSRLLPVADPKTRQAHLGLGAAVFLLRLALSTLDRAVEVVPWPDSGQPDLVARLVVGGRQAADRRGPAAARGAPGPPDRSHPVHQLTPCRSGCRSPGATWPRPRAPGCAGSRHPESGSASPRSSPRPSGSSSATRRTWPSSTGGPRPDTSTRAPACRRHAFGVSAAVGHAAEFPLRDFAGGTRTDPAPARRAARGAPGRRPSCTPRPTGPTTGCAAARPSCGCCSRRPPTDTPRRTSTSRSSCPACASNYATSSGSPAGRS